MSSRPNQAPRVERLLLWDGVQAQILSSFRKALLKECSSWLVSAIWGVDDHHILEEVTKGMGVSEAHALVAFLTAAPDNGGEGWLVGAINNKV